MRKIILILLLLSLFFGSCQYFDKQIPSEKVLLEKELNEINWNEVDEFPSVTNCDSLADKEQKKQCFFDYVSQLIQQKLNADTLPVLYPKRDTIDVIITVMPDATMQFEPQLKDSLMYDRNKVDSILRTRLIDFPKINPALKRGIPVKTQFVLPVILLVE